MFLFRFLFLDFDDVYDFVESLVFVERICMLCWFCCKIDCDDEVDEISSSDLVLLMNLL